MIALESLTLENIIRLIDLQDVLLCRGEISWESLAKETGWTVKTLQLYIGRLKSLGAEIERAGDGIRIVSVVDLRQWIGDLVKMKVKK